MVTGFDRKESGRQGESLAAFFLEKLGWRILGRNVRCALGEIDLLAEDEEALVVVEVKQVSRPSIDPIFKIDSRKRQKLSQLAQVVAMKAPGRNIRVDAVTVTGLVHNPRITHYRNIITFS